MDKILLTELQFKHIITKKEGKQPHKKLNKNATKNAENKSTKPLLNELDPYLNELISRINIVNEEFYDYIIYECGYKNASKEFKKGVRSHLDKVMVNYFTK